MRREAGRASLARAYGPDEPEHTLAGVCSAEKRMSLVSKKSYDRVIATVRSVIHDWDPYGLLEMGCPLDEFDTEIGCVATYVPHIGSANDAAQAISTVFSASFEEAGFSTQDCAGVGEALFEALSRSGLLTGE